MNSVLNRRQNLLCRLVLGICFLALVTVGRIGVTEAAESALVREQNAGIDVSFASQSEPSQPFQVNVYDVSQLLRSLAERESGSVEEQRLTLSSLLQALAGVPVDVQQDQLIIRTTAANHRRISELLSLWQRTGLQQIALEIRFISAADSVLESLDLPERRLLTEPPPASVHPPAFDRPLTFPGQADTELTAAHLEITKWTPVRLETLTGEQTRQLVQTAQGDATANFLQAPKVTVFNGQSATIADVVERPFVAGVETVDGVDQPQVRVLSEGSKVHLRAVTDGRSNTLRLDCRLELDRVGDVGTAKLSDSQSVQIPAWYRQTIAFAADVTADHTLLIEAPASSYSDAANEISVSGLTRVGHRLLGKRAEDPRQLYVLITPRLLDL